MKKSLLLYGTLSFALFLNTAWAADQDKSSSPAGSASSAPTAAPVSTPAKPAASASQSRSLPIQTIFDEQDSQVEVVADQLEYSRAQKKMIAQGHAVITYQNVKITSDYAEVDTQAKQAYARGHVFIFRGDSLASKGEQVYYDFGNHTGRFPDARVVTEPWFVNGQKVDQVSQGVLKVDEGCLTTCYQEENPNYKIRAKSVTLYTGDKMIARNVTLYIMDKPVFWLPYMILPLNLKQAPIMVNPGYSSEDGGYIKTAVGYSINGNLSGKILADWRAKRGAGGGAILDYDYGKYFQGQVVGYLTQDKRAPTPGSLNAEGLEDPYGNTEDHTRGRLTWRHRTDFAPHTHIIAKYHRAEDEYVLRDFFHQEERIETEQHSFVAATHNTERYGLLVHAEKRMNNFESIVEKLPELRADWRNQPFMKPWLFYQSRAGYVNFHNRYERSDREEDVNRFDNVHEWSAPVKWNELKFTPYVNARGTYYTRQRNDPEDRFRTALGGGMDVRTQYYKTYNVTSDKAGIEINNLRHVVEPSVGVNSIHPSSVGDESLTHFDRVDKIDDMDVVTLGLENRLQTKRVINGKMQRVDIVSFNTFLNYVAHPRSIDDPNYISSVDPEVVLRPYQWLQYEARARYDVDNHNFQVFNQDLITRLGRAKFLFGNRFVQNPETISSAGALDVSNLVLFEASYQLSKLWKVGGYISFDADSAILQEWQVSATRDLGCLWLLDFGFDVRNSDISESNKELYFNLRMKNYPDFGLRTGSRATFADPRIGETVAGANQFGGIQSSRYYYENY
ncbi:MAG: LPS assembly protein LptD [Candidatus Omnitrophica bacterium]|nr:LPS assembly protein LptD [Candidatus Omnitrophota bacterium]